MNAEVGNERRGIGAVLFVLLVVVAWVGLGWFLGSEGESIAAVETEPVRLADVTFVSDPVGARVFISGIDQGVTPLTLALPVGRTLGYAVRVVEPVGEFGSYEPYYGLLTVGESALVDVVIPQSSPEAREAARIREAEALEAARVAQEEAAALEAARLAAAAADAAVEARRAADAAAAAALERQRRLESASIVVEGWNWSRSDREQRMTYTGRVTNNSGSTLNLVKVFAEFFTGDGEFVSSDSTFLDITALLPGQTSTFTGYARWNPAAERASIRFVTSRGVELVSVEREDF